jgi:cbb3-type cytochrome oxidase cytochrome c subunit
MGRIDHIQELAYVGGLYKTSDWLHQMHLEDPLRGVPLDILPHQIRR